MTYNDITIYQYQQIRELVEEKLSDYDTQVALIAILFGMTEDEVLDLPMNKYKKYAEKIQFLLESPKPQADASRKIRINGKKYWIMRDLNKMTAAQFIDYQSLTKDGSDKHLHQILALYIIPKGKEYGKGYDVAEAATEIQHHLSLQQAINLSFFLHLRQVKSLRHTAICLMVMSGLMSKIGSKRMRAKMKMINSKMKQILSTKNGVG